MSSAQDRPTDRPQGGQVGQGTSGPGTTAGGPGMTGDPMTTGAGRHANPSATSGYERGTAAGSPPEAATYETSALSGAAGGTFLVVAGLLTFFAGLAAVVRASYFHAVT